MLSLSLCLAVLEDPQDNVAYTAFFNRYRRLVLHKANLIVKNYEAAEDVAQEVFLYAAEHFEKFRDQDSRKAVHYLMLCTVSRAIDSLHEEEKRDYIELEHMDEGRIHIESVEWVVLQQEKTERVLNTIKTLPEIYCAALLLKLNGESYTQIAEMLNISKENAYKRVQRGYTMIRERLAEEDGK